MKRVIVLALLAVLILSATSCTSDNGKQIGSQEQVGEDFIMECFSADKGQRFQTFSSELEDRRDEASLQDAIKKYHSGLTALASEECISSMMKSRFLFRFDSMYDGVPVSVENISVSGFDENGNASFSVEILAGSERETYRGQITVGKSSGKFLVDRFWCEM